MALNLNFDKVTRIESGTVIPGAVANYSLIPALQFKVQDEVILTKVVAFCKGFDSVTGLNIPLKSFELRLLGGGTTGAIVESGIGSGLGIAAQLSNKDFGGFSTLQYIELNFPEGMQIDQTGYIRAGLFWIFEAALATLRLNWYVDFYLKSPAPITILFEQ